MIKNILFDLDGTLLPMDNDVFAKGYLGMLAEKMAPYGYEPNKFISSIWKATEAVYKNDGLKLNEEVFWDNFSALLGNKVLTDIDKFDDFYANDFCFAKKFCGYNPDAVNTVELLKEKGFNLILATNPIFPQVATDERIKWAGLKKQDFIYCSTHENSHYSKPNSKYYIELTDKLSLNPQECLMVGNDVYEDAVAASSIGMNTFLITDFLINRKNIDISTYPKGNFNSLISYIKNFS